MVLWEKKRKGTDFPEGLKTGSKEFKICVELVLNGKHYLLALLTKTEDWGYDQPCVADVYTLDC